MRKSAFFSHKNINAYFRILLHLVLLFMMTGIPGAAQALAQDAHTLLLLHFNDSLTGAGGEVPTQATGVTFEDGIFGKGAYFPVGNQVFYPSAENIDSTEGTFEFWIKPKWNGNDGQNHVVMIFGVGGGMKYTKDGANNLRSILNLGGEGGNPEIGIEINVEGEWNANEWHHTAFTWSSESIKLYIDGIKRTEETVTFPLPLVDETTFQIGADNVFSYLNAVLDELHISSIERSPQEIFESFVAGLTISSITIQPESHLITQPDTIKIMETWWSEPDLIADTNHGSKTIPSFCADWSSSDPGVASVDSAGRITGIAAGSATITAEYFGKQDTLEVNVKAPVLPPDIEAIDPYLAAPAEGHLYEMPVVIIRYLPTKDGIYVDTNKTGWDSTLDALEMGIDRLTKRVKFKLEERSRFRGYKDPTVIPSLGYRVIYIVTVYEELPLDKEVPWNPGVYFPDYNQILTRFNAANFVNNLGVKEFWIWGYHFGNTEQPESNMSSPTTGDISNSSRFNDDMPVFNKTYMLYGYNFTRSQAEAVHNHGHQLESILSHVNWYQDGNSDLFWKKFVGQDTTGNFITGRCGWTHMPPNTLDHYDYLNPTIVESDIEDWTPERVGNTKMVNVDTWGDLIYAWPDGETDFGQRIESQFYLYWMQSMPGYKNAIKHGNNYMTNWWEFTADWDKSINSGLGLYEAIRKSDLLGTWGGQGVWYRDSDSGAWVPVASPATQIAAGDIDNDGIDDLLGLWPGQGGVWVKYSDSGNWELLSTTPDWFGAGDMDGDGREDLLGTWAGLGVYYRNSATGVWLKIASPASKITCGDLDGDGADDLIGIWPSQGGVWVKYSATTTWEQLASTAGWICSGDMNGDCRDDFVGSWSGQGVYYRDTATGTWYKMASSASQITCGDMDGDGMDDLVGIWAGQGGVWVKYSGDSSWEMLSSTADWIACGRMRSGGGGTNSEQAALTGPVGGIAKWPYLSDPSNDFSISAPGASRFVFTEQPNLTPKMNRNSISKYNPGPGERGFECIEQPNFIPRKMPKRRGRKR